MSRSMSADPISRLAFAISEIDKCLGQKLRPRASRSPLCGDGERGERFRSLGGRARARRHCPGPGRGCGRAAGAAPGWGVAVNLRHVTHHAPRAGARPQRSAVATGSGRGNSCCRWIGVFAPSCARPPGSHRRRRLRLSIWSACQRRCSRRARNALFHLTDSQLAAVTRACKPLQSLERRAFLEALADHLQGHRELGNGALHRVLAELQRQYFSPPLLSRDE